MTREQWLYRQLQGLRYQVNLEREDLIEEYEDFQDVSSKRAASSLRHVVRRIDNIIYKYQRREEGQ